MTHWIRQTWYHLQQTSLHLLRLLEDVAMRNWTLYGVASTYSTETGHGILGLVLYAAPRRGVVCRFFDTHPSIVVFFQTIPSQ